MADLVTYEVAREHTGDGYVPGEGGALVLQAKHFAKGDERIADPAQVKHLVNAGVLLEPKGKASAEAEKAAPATKDKAAPAPANKADTPPAKKDEA